MSSKVTKTLSFVRPADIIQMAREKKLEKFGFAPLPQQIEWVFGENFPTVSFFLRGAAAKVVYQWSLELMEFYNDGDCVVENLIKKYNCGGLMANDGNDFDLPGSRTLSFEFPAGSSNVIFPKHPNLAITSVASIAKLGEWCTVGHIEWGWGNHREGDWWHSNVDHLQQHRGRRGPVQAGNLFEAAGFCYQWRQ